MRHQSVTPPFNLRSHWPRWAGLFAISVCLGMSGCASTGGEKARPDWVDGPAAQYPAGEYLVGRGDAESVELAQERARADLAKIFEVSIAVDASDTQGAQGGTDTMQYAAKSERRIVTHTEKVIAGVRIGDLWRAPVLEKGGAGRQYALAVLSRLPAAMALRHEIAERDEAIQRAVARARNAEDALDRAGWAHRAVDLALERAGFDKSLRVVDVGGRGVDTTLSTARLQTDLAEQLKKVALVPKLAITGPFDGDSLLPVVQGGIAASGFLAADKPGATPYSLQVNVRMTEQFVEGWHWVRGNIEVTMTDAVGRVRGSQSWPIKASAQTQKAAHTRGLLEIESLLKTSLRPAILGFAAS